MGRSAYTCLRRCQAATISRVAAVVQAIEDAYGDRVIIGNVNKQSLEELADGVAHATLAFAQTASAVSGTEKGEGAPKKPRYKGPLALR